MSKSQLQRRILAFSGVTINAQRKLLEEDVANEALAAFIDVIACKIIHLQYFRMILESFAIKKKKPSLEIESQRVAAEMPETLGMTGGMEIPFRQ